MAHSTSSLLLCRSASRCRPSRSPSTNPQSAHQQPIRRHESISRTRGHGRTSVRLATFRTSRTGLAALHHAPSFWPSRSASSRMIQ
jgi:hypothetical protein